MCEDVNQLEVELYNYKANQTEEGVPSNTGQVLVDDQDNDDELLNNGGDDQRSMLQLILFCMWYNISRSLTFFAHWTGRSARGCTHSPKPVAVTQAQALSMGGGKGWEREKAWWDGRANDRRVGTGARQRERESERV